MNAVRVVALLGQRDEPTDGVADYCEWLGQAMRAKGFALETYRVAWSDRGWGPALRDLRVEASGWAGCWVLLQFTNLAWSRRGFPLHAPRVLEVLQQRGARCGVVFHDAHPFGGDRMTDRVRRYCQVRAMRTLCERADRAIFTVPVDKIAWLPPRQERTVFIPVGANCPEPHAASRQVRADVNGAKTVAVYSVTGGAETVREISDIGFAMKRALRAAGPLNLVVFGRGSQEAESALRAEFAGTGVNVETLGLLSRKDVTQTLVCADVLLFVRGSISSRRGSAVAGIACGLPIVCYAGTETAWPITEAGVLAVPQDDREAISEALQRVLTDDALRALLGERSRRAQAQYFCWPAIASRYADALGRPSRTRGEDLSMRSGSAVRIA